MWLDRTVLMLKKENMEKLENARVAVLGLGGVGGAAAESLVRTGIGHLLFADNDTVSETNLNRQILATLDTVGMDKISAAESRFRSINPKGDFTFVKEFYLPDNSDWLFDWKPDYIIDAIDTVTAKIDLARKANEHGIGLFMCLGTGNRLSPECLRMGDLSETKGCGCPLAKVLRHELKKYGIEHRRVLFSTEEPIHALADDCEIGRHSPGSISFVPPVAGYMLAADCVKKIISEEGSL